MSNNDTVTGSLVITGLPDLACFTNFTDLLKALPSFLSVQVPASVTNVIVSNIQPGDDQRNSIWFRLGNSGGFIGIYVYSAGTWRQIFPTPQGIFWMQGDSRDVPDGYNLLDTDSNPYFTPEQLAKLKKQYIRDLTDTFYVYFATYWIGF